MKFQIQQNKLRDEVKKRIFDGFGSHAITINLMMKGNVCPEQQSRSQDHLEVNESFHKERRLLNYDYQEKYCEFDHH